MCVKKVHKQENSLHSLWLRKNYTTVRDVPSVQQHWILKNNVSLPFTGVHNNHCQTAVCNCQVPV